MSKLLFRNENTRNNDIMLQREPGYEINGLIQQFTIIKLAIYND